MYSKQEEKAKLSWYNGRDYLDFTSFDTWKVDTIPNDLKNEKDLISYLNDKNLKNCDVYCYTKEENDEIEIMGYEII